MQYQSLYFQLFLAAATLSTQKVEAGKPVRMPVVKKRHTKPGREPLTGHKDEYWSGQMSIGTPKQGFNIDFDTGSANTWINSAKCTSGCGTCARYDSSKSSTYVKNGEKFEIDYADGSGDKGYLSEDTVEIAGLVAKKNTFAEVTEQYGPPNTQGFCGIVGLGFQELAVDGVKPFVQSLVEDVGLEPKFAFYLPESQSNQTGELVIGGIDTADFVPPLHAAKVKNTGGYWSVDASVSVNGVMTQKDVVSIIDSGSTIMYPNTATANAVNNAIPTNAEGAAKCSVIASKGPTMTVSIGGGSFNITGKDYEYNIGQGECIPAVQDGGSEPLFGDIFLRVVYSVFDLKEKTISFAYTKQRNGNAL